MPAFRPVVFSSLASAPDLRIPPLPALHEQLERYPLVQLPLSVKYPLPVTGSSGGVHRRPPSIQSCCWPTGPLRPADGFPPSLVARDCHACIRFQTSLQTADYPIVNIPADNLAALQTDAETLLTQAEKVLEAICSTLAAGALERDPALAKRRLRGHAVSYLIGPVRGRRTQAFNSVSLLQTTMRLCRSRSPIGRKWSGVGHAWLTRPVGRLLRSRAKQGRLERFGSTGPAAR